MLAIDAATEECSAALWVDGTVLARGERIGRGHAARLLPMVDELLAEAGLGLAGLDGIACGRGPGSFTGVRVAVGLAQGLALGADRPVVPVSDLVALAARVGPAASAVLACLDARMGEVYWAEVRSGPDGWVALSEAVGPPGAVRLDSDRATGVGTGLAAHPALRARLAGRLVAVRDDWLPRAEQVAALAVPVLRAGGGLDPAALEPTYLRNDVATPSRRQVTGS